MGAAPSLCLCLWLEGVLQMPLYMYQGSYTAEAVADQIAKPQNRLEAVRPAFQAMGVTFKEGGYAFGEYDVVVLYEAPDDITAAALALAIAAGGAIRSAKTTRLLSPEEWVKSLKMARTSEYKPPR
jgi:uncharacterized protein with GYD domain